MEADGNLITYGWIFLVNTLLRNLLSNAAIKMTSQNLVVIGAGLQMLIFALNVVMLVCSLEPVDVPFPVRLSEPTGWDSHLKNIYYGRWC